MPTTPSQVSVDSRHIEEIEENINAVCTLEVLALQSQEFIFYWYSTYCTVYWGLYIQSKYFSDAVKYCKVNYVDHLIFHFFTMQL